MRKGQLCIYCGQRESTRKGDHVPPQSFFPSSRMHPLIQVPCCTECNVIISADDERVRNLFVSVDMVENHPVIETELREKRNRSLVKQKKKGGVTTRNLEHLLKSTQLKDRYSEGGIYLGQAPALIVNQPVVHRFIDRMARALHHHRYNTGFIECEIEKSNVIDGELQEFFETYRPTSHESFGEDIFLYAEFTPDPHQISLWLMRFFGFVEFWASVKPCATG